MENTKENNIKKYSLNELKDKLKPKEKLQHYFQRMLKYYKKMNDRKNYYLYDLANKSYYSLEKKFKFKIDYDKSPFVSNMFQFLKEQLQPVNDTNNSLVYKEYQGPESFGFLIFEDTEYFYVFKNEYNRKLFNDINKVKLYELKNYNVVPITRNSNITGKDNINTIESHFLASEDFENKINNFFKRFSLVELPNYFFRLINKNPFKGKKSKEKKINREEIIEVNTVIQNIFSAYIEIDGAFAYYGISPFIIINEGNKLFKVSKTLDVSSFGEDIKINDNESNKLILNPNTVVIIEDKLGFPPVINDFKKGKKITKEKLYTSLNFIIYKTIRKINIMNEYLISTTEEKNKTYSYYLLLVYDSNPISDVENILKTILNDLCKEKLIKYPTFKLKVIYALPCISLNDSTTIAELKNEIIDLKTTIEEMRKEMEEIKKIKENAQTNNQISINNK